MIFNNIGLKRKESLIIIIGNIYNISYNLLIINIFNPSAFIFYKRSKIITLKRPDKQSKYNTFLGFTTKIPIMPDRNQFNIL